jgi:hypothetical protein
VFVESFYGKFRNHLLAIEMNNALLEIKVVAENYHQHYNTYRHHSSLEDRTPNDFTPDWHNNPRDSPRHGRTRRVRAVSPSMRRITGLVQGILGLLSSTVVVSFLRLEAS